LFIYFKNGIIIAILFKTKIIKNLTFQIARSMNHYITLVLVMAFLFINSNIFGSTTSMKVTDSLHYTNKTIPKTISDEALKALSFYPELKDTQIEIRFKDNIKKSFMQAQPGFSSLFKKKSKRKYYILIGKNFVIDGEEIEVTDIPSDVLVGWIGHELGHIIDYKNRSGFNLITFGMSYITSKKFLMNAERAADTYAVNHGMADYILATKDFILSHAGLSEEYRERIKRLYLSPEEILEIVEEIKE